MGVGTSTFERDEFIADTLDNIDEDIFDENGKKLNLNDIIETLNGIYYTREDKYFSKYGYRRDLLEKYICEYWKKRLNI